MIVVCTHAHKIGEVGVGNEVAESIGGHPSIRGAYENLAGPPKFICHNREVGPAHESLIWLFQEFAPSAVRDRFQRGIAIIVIVRPKAISCADLFEVVYAAYATGPATSAFVRRNEHRQQH